MIKVVLFDVGGVLYTDPGKQMHASIIETLGVTPDAWYQVWSEVYEPFSKGMLSEERLWQIVTKKLALHKEIPADLFLQAHMTYLQPNEPMLKAARRLVELGIQIGILSNIYKPQADYNKTKGIYEGFSPVILSCDVGMKKPEKAIFSYALSLLNIPAEEILFLDDKEKNVETAKQLGFTATQYGGSTNVVELFRTVGISL